MNLRPKKQEEPDVNLTPLIDIVFLMLIFFMVSTTFEKESAVKVELPKASSSGEMVEEKTVEITINAKGEYFIDRASVLNRDPETLKAAIIKHTGGNTETPLVVRSDGNAPVQSMVTVMDIAGQLGYPTVPMQTIRAEKRK